jgi:putative holliday junction resolvase
MRYLGIDLGSKRIGLALSDETGLIATPLTTLQVRNEPQVFADIIQTVNEYDIAKIIVGLPIMLNGTEGIEANRARAFADRLKQKINIEIDLMDERLTSIEAERRMTELRIKKQKRKANIDSAAAAIFLQTYLDKERREKREERGKKEE